MRMEPCLLLAARGAAEPLDGAGHVGLDLVDGDAEAPGDAAVGQIVELWSPATR
ncbi:MAG: hypothetical protein P8Y48_18395 [Novosphingobium sp.]